MSAAPRTEAPELVLTNARLVLPGDVLHGTLTARDGRIAVVDPGRSAAPGALDLDGDLLIPGAVDLHTDNLERQVMPRIGARWPARSAMLAHDAQCAAAGVTTVFDALCVGDLGFDEARTRTLRDGVSELDALGDTGLLRAEHVLHLRCELPAPEMLELLDEVVDHPLLRMISLMDHCPGVGQFADLETYRKLRRGEGVPPKELEARIARSQALRARHREPNRRALLARVAGRGVALASHDDRTAAEVATNHADGIGISEFPVTAEAAGTAGRLGMGVIAGAPNVVRGGSHSGNVSAAALLRDGLADALASDYVPAALIDAAFRAVELVGLTLPEAVALITSRPAAMAGLDDRGAIAPGLRADLVRVRLYEGQPVVRSVWRAGARVA